MLSTDLLARLVAALRWGEFWRLLGAGERSRFRRGRRRSGSRVWQSDQHPRGWSRVQLELGGGLNLRGRGCSELGRTAAGSRCCVSTVWLSLVPLALRPHTLTHLASLRSKYYTGQAGRASGAGRRPGPAAAGVPRDALPRGHQEWPAAGRSPPRGAPCHSFLLLIFSRAAASQHKRGGAAALRRCCRPQSTQGTDALAPAGIAWVPQARPSWTILLHDQACAAPRCGGVLMPLRLKAL
jgi:hypothetical protein